MSKAKYEGGCQCQAVRYRCNADPYVAYTCHCNACKKLTASAFATCMQVPAEVLEVTQGVPLSSKRVSDDGNTLETWFCGRCGSALFTANSARPRLRTIYVGTLDKPDDVEVSAHIWVSQKLPWVSLPSGHRVFTEGGDWRADYAQDPSRLEG